MRIVVDYENFANEWWDAARAAAHCPDQLRPLIHGDKDEVEVDERDVARLLAWCAVLPGWAEGPSFARTALLVTEDDDNACPGGPRAE